MTDLARRYSGNPILTAEMITPSQDTFTVACVLNPGAFTYQGRIWLVMRVAERPKPKEGFLRLPIMAAGRLEIVDIPLDDPDLDAGDPREVTYRGEGYITTISHLRLAASEDGLRFVIHEDKCLFGCGDHEIYGIEDCRVACIDHQFYLTYTALSEYGYGIGMRSTHDWRSYSHHGIVISGPNKDCALFEEKINGFYYALHRPSMVIVGGHYLWLTQSSDLTFWGRHQCIAKTRPGKWDSARIGAGASPIKTERGWLVIYHGADERHRYCLGALLLALNDPSLVLARSNEPIMEPFMEYERNGFLGNVIFTNGHIVQGDTIKLYYGASDSVICQAEFSVSEILGVLEYE